MLSHHQDLPLSKTYREITFFLIFKLLFALLISLVLLVVAVLIPIYLLPSLFSLFGLMSQTTLLGVVLCLWAIFTFLGSFYLFLKSLRCRLILTDQGIIRYDVAENQFTPWSNIMGIVYQGKEKGLRLREPASCSNLEEGLQRNIPALEINQIGSRRDLHVTFFPIPKEISESDWEKGMLGAYLRRYAFYTPQEPE